MYARLVSSPLHHWYPTHYITGTQRVPKFTPTVPKFTPRVPNLWIVNFGPKFTLPVHKFTSVSCHHDPAINFAPDLHAKETARIGVSAGRNGVGGDDDGPKNKLATPRHASVMMTDRRLSTSAIAGIRGLGSSGGYAPPAHIDRLGPFLCKKSDLT